MRAKFKNKIKKSSFVKNNFFENFYFGSKPLIIQAFLIPPRLPMCNYRCNRSPLFAKNSRLGYFFNAKSPQGESNDTEIAESIYKNFRFKGRKKFIIKKTQSLSTKNPSLFFKERGFLLLNISDKNITLSNYFCSFAIFLYRLAIKPVPAGIKRPTMIFSFKPRKLSTRP